VLGSKHKLEIGCSEVYSWGFYVFPKHQYKCHKRNQDIFLTISSGFISWLGAPLSNGILRDVRLEQPCNGGIKPSAVWCCVAGLVVPHFSEESDPYSLKNKNQIEATYYFIVLLIGSTCFGHYYAHNQELTTIMLITTLVVSFLGCCRLAFRCRQAGVVSGLQFIAIACRPDTTPAYPHLISNLQQPKNETTNVVINNRVVSSWWWA